MREELEKDWSCPECGDTLPDGAPKGMCPACLMAVAMQPTATIAKEAYSVPAPEIDSIKDSFPQLEIIELIGSGGMGVVYKAKQRSLNREVALKLLAPKKGNDQDFADRFEREAQALATMNHPNIITVHDFGKAGGFYYLLMEFVDGVNLRKVLEKGRFTPEEALAIVPPICDALQYAHDQGVVHRDIKPENLLLDHFGRVKVADFGIAKLINQDALESVSEEVDQLGIDLTQGATLGTPNYMAPEQVDSPAGVDHRADIYSLGVVFYEILTGERPGESLKAPSSKIEVDVRLDEVVLRALADAPELRWQNATDLKTQIETIAAAEPVRPVVEQKDDSESKKDSLGYSIGALALIVGGIVLAYFLSQNSKPEEPTKSPYLSIAKELNREEEIQNIDSSEGKSAKKADEVVADFLEASDWQARMPFIHKNISLRKRIEQYYNEYPDFSFADDPLGKYQLKLVERESDIALGGPFLIYELSIGESEKRLPIILRDDAGELKVDWVAFVEFFDQHYVKLVEGKIESPVDLRLKLKPVNYPGSDKLAFEDLKKYTCYEIKPPYESKEKTEYAFVVKDSGVGQHLAQLIPPSENESPLVTVSLSQKEFSHGIRHFVIDRLITDRWFLPSDESRIEKPLPPNRWELRKQFSAPGKDDSPLTNTHDLVDSYLRAADWGERLQWTYNGEELSPKIEAYYKMHPDFSISKFRMKLFMMELDREYGGPFWMFQISTGSDTSETPILLREQDGLLKVDWEVFSEFLDKKFVTYCKNKDAKNQTGQFRLVAKRVAVYPEYDGEGFDNHADYLCFKIHPPYGKLREFKEYAFVKKGTDLAKRLNSIMPLKDDSLAVILKLNRKTFDHGMSHYVIEDLVNEGWIQ